MTFVLSLAVLFYAVPRLPLQWEGTLPNWFAFFWLVFAFLVVAANWRAVLGIDRKQRREERVKRFGEWQRHQQDRRQLSYLGE